MARYWIMRTSKNERTLIGNELNEGRLRQGWGYQDDQDLRIIRKQISDGIALSDDQRRCWRGNRRMLEYEHDGIREGDSIVLPNIPQHGNWSIVTVIGPYDYMSENGNKDFRHVLPIVKRVQRPVYPHEESVSARLRQTMRNRLRLWNVDTLGVEIERMITAVENGAPGNSVLDRMPGIFDSVRTDMWEKLQRSYQGKEFEAPCISLLKVLYGEDNVEYTAGKNERGADAICTHTDPLGLTYRVAVQIKMWDWDANDTRPLRQIEEAYNSHDSIRAGIIIVTTEDCTTEFNNCKIDLEANLRIPIRTIFRKEFLDMLIANLPNIVSETSDTSIDE